MTIEFNTVKPNLDLVETKNGPMYVYKNDLAINKAIRTYGEHCHAEVDIMKLFTEENTIYVTVGVNVGYHVLAMNKEANCSVLGFEPNPSHFVVAAENCKDLPIQLFNAALGSSVGIIKMPTMDGTGTFEIQCVTLDSLNLPKVSGLKLNVNDNNLSILTGADNTINMYRPTILYKATDISWKQTYSFIDGKGYKQYWVNCLNTPVKEDTFTDKKGIMIDGSVISILAIPIEKPQVGNLMPVVQDESYETCSDKIKSYVIAF